MDSLEWAQRDAALANTVHQFAAACQVLMDRTGQDCKRDLWDVLEAVLNDAAKQFSFREVTDELISQYQQCCRELAEEKGKSFFLSEKVKALEVKIKSQAEGLEVRSRQVREQTEKLRLALEDVESLSAVRSMAKREALRPARSKKQSKKKTAAKRK